MFSYETDNKPFFSCGDYISGHKIGIRSNMKARQEQKQAEGTGSFIEEKQVKNSGTVIIVVIHWCYHYYDN